MAGIAKTHVSPWLDGHPVTQAWVAPGHGLVPRLVTAMAERQAHPSRTLVLLPYAQAVPEARRQWLRHQADQGAAGVAFVPRFETTQSWARSLGWDTPAGDDLCFDAGRDLLTAQSLLDRAGLASQRELLGARLVDAAQQLAPVVAALPPEARPAWAERVRPQLALGLDPSAMALELVVARLALEWALASSHPTDALFGADLSAAWDCVALVPGFAADPLAQALAERLGPRAVTLALDAGPAAASGAVQLQPAGDSEDEALRAASCVLRHLQAGRAPVALVATDRALTRRIRALLATREVALRDETGWKLSTTRAAARLMGALRACAWRAGTDAVLDWLKNAPAVDALALQALEQALRRSGVRDWAQVGLPASAPAGALALLAQVQAWRAPRQASRGLPQWRDSLHTLLQDTGQWDALGADAAGEAVLNALHLPMSARQALAQQLAAAERPARRWSLADFSAWVDTVLEAASYVPAAAAEAQVVILPLSQMLGRPFAAAVLPGCDELRLSPSPEPPGDWTTAQRRALGLPARDALAAAQWAAWQHALLTPQVDLLWRSSDDGGEAVLPSPWVQRLLLQRRQTGAAVGGVQPLDQRSIAPAPSLRPQPVGADLPMHTLSATAYDDLRRCPYRFFALRQLRLQPADEIDQDIDKRDFGLWLHATLGQFHEALAASPTNDRAVRRALADAAAQAAATQLALPQGEFLPFTAAWPGLREGYLDWLDGHEAQGLRFVDAERWCEQPLGALRLAGRLDRLDRDAQGQAWVLDYKTEGQSVTRQRLKRPLEDTQLAFYAALLPEDTLCAAYVNVGEREGTKTLEQTDIVAVRDALVTGITDDFARIAQGQPLPALGDGSDCDHCKARGLCRKDFW